MNNSAIWDRSLAGGELGSDINAYDYTVFYPTSGMSDLSAYKSFRFHINQKNLNLHLRYAQLIFHGKLTGKAAGAVISKSDKNAPAHNFFLHLFTNCKASVAGTVVEE